MANIMQMFRAKNKVSRNAFDLSKKVAFTAKAGELLPIYSRVLMAGDVLDIDTAWKSRTAPVNTAAFTRFKENYDWYFVPFNLLWNKYNTWSTNMKENNQVATSINGTTTLTDEHPYFTSEQISLAIENLAFEYANGFPSSGANIDKVNTFGFGRANLACKLLHYLGYGDFYPQGDSNLSYSYATQVQQFKASPWRLLAYQKIYQDWYRNSQWEAARPETCNIDYLDGSSESLSIPVTDIDFSKVCMFDLQYANWNKDMFTGVLPNSQYGDAASINMADLNEYMPLYVQNGSTTVLGSGSKLGPFGNLTANGGVQAVGLSESSSSGTEYNALFRLGGGKLVTQFSILALRQAEALQKFKEIQQSNSQDFPSQTEAHFGHRPNNAYSSRSTRIGGYDGVIEISDVDNTNITENSDGTMNGADIAGKGLARGRGNLNNFKADVPGVIMCIYHVRPLLDYALDGIAPDNLKTLFTDYAIPEFDKTGMQQVPLIMLTNRKKDSWNSFNVGSGLLGYAPNYFDYKTDVDTVLGAFYNGGLESWVSPITKSYIDSFLEEVGGSNTDPVFTGINYNFFKINPTILDSIFAVNANSRVNTDTFWINCYFDIKAVRPLDVDGLPY